MKHSPATFLLALLVSASCAELPQVSANACGNGVLEAGEECDTFDKDGARCRKAGEANACRFDCSAGKACPTGWSCGADGVCREPTGAFASAASHSFEANAFRLQIGDFDGDGVGDVMASARPDENGRTTPRIHFFDDVTRPPASVFPIRATALTPTMFDVDGDGLLDVVFSSFDAGVNVMLGTQERVLAPVAFARFPFPPGSTARIVRVFGVAIPFGQSPVVLAEVPPLGRLIIPGATASGMGGSPFDLPLSGLDRSPLDLLGDPVAANVSEATTCDELLWAWKGDDTISLAELCGADNYWRAAPMAMPKRPLIIGEKIVREPLAIDLNGDKHVDLLVQGTTSAWIAFGRGDGTFAPKPDLTGGNGAARVSCEFFDYAAPAPGRFVAGKCAAPLAVSKYGARADGQIFVLPNQLFEVRKLADVSDATGPRMLFSGRTLAARETGEWTTAVVGDFNANQLVDVAAGSNGGPDFDFYNGTPFGLFNPSKVSTDGPVSKLAVGDFDGDLVLDIGFTERGIATDVGGKLLDGFSVAYGRVMSPPETPFRMGVFPNIHQAMAGKFAGFHAIEAMGLVFTAQDGGDRIAVLEGNGERQLLSPIGVADELMGKLVQTIAFAVTVGDVDGDKNPDIAIAAFDRGERELDPAGLRLWLSKGQGGARFSPPELSKRLDTITIGIADQSSEARYAVTAWLRTADLDHDGKAEVVMLGAGVTAGSHPTLLVAKAVPGGEGPVLEPKWTGALANVGTARPSSDVQLADIDGDGNVDAVLLIDPQVRTPADVPTVFVAWGKGDGTFDMAAPAILALPEGAGAPRGIALFQADLDAAREIGIVTDQGVFLAQGPARTLTAMRLPGLRGGISIAAGDLDGDGIVDLAIGDANRVILHLGEPRQK